MTDRVLVVGGGPAGLAAAGALKQRGIAGTILERSEAVGASWRNHYDRLHLHTHRRLSNLPGLPIPAASGRWVARDDVVRYLELYRRHFDLQVRTGVEVQRIDRDGGGWRLTTSSGPLAAPVVVVATGYNREAVEPAWPGVESFGGEVVHSSRYRSSQPYRGKRVLVVGSGNSGAEIAVDLVEGGAAAVFVAIRTPPNIQHRAVLGIPTQVVGILASRLPRGLADGISLALQKASIGDLRPYGLDPPARGAMTRIYEDAQIPMLDVGFLAALKARRLEVVPAVEGLDGEEVLLKGGRRLEVDAVIAATGFARGLEPLVGHLGLLDRKGVPVVAGAEESPRAPGLHFIGYRNAPGGLLRQIRLESEALAGRLAGSERARGTASGPPQ